MTINLPDFHYELGKPSKVYPYRNADGETYAAVYRFDTPKGKTIRPYDISRQRWKFPDNPLPYHVDYLENLKTTSAFSKKSTLEKSEKSEKSTSKKSEMSEFPKNPVIIVEGEKCADILGSFGNSENFGISRIIGITSLGGSGQANKTDWSSLKDRDVVIWPDNDEAGQKYARTLQPILHNVGVASLRICNVTRDTLHNVLHTYVDNLKDAELLKEGNILKEVYNLKVNSSLRSGILKDNLTPTTDIENLPKGWDVADAVAEGWQFEHIALLISKSTPMEKPANDNDMTLWNLPNLSILDIDAPPPKLPISIFSPPIADWLIKTAEGRAAPVDYVAGTLLAAAASLIGNSRKVSPWESWSEPCILWISLIGSPSSGKSPAMEPVLELISKLEADDMPDFEQMLLDHERNKLEAQMARTSWEKDVITADEKGMGAPSMPKGALEPTPPQRPRLVVRDATTEALSLALQSQPKGLLMNRDELAGWFGSFDRYSGGKGGDRPFWLECFGGRTFTQDRVKNGAAPITIPHMSVSIIGSIQPDKLQTCLMKGDDDGLSSRFLYIYPKPVPRKRPRHIANRETIERTLKRLHSLTMDTDESHIAISRTIPLSAHASYIFEAWWQDLAIDEPTGKLSSWNGKLGGIALRLSLTLTYLEWASSHDAPEPYEVTPGNIERAITLIDSYLTPMAERAFGSASKTDADQNTIMLANWIIENHIEEFNIRDLQRSGPMRQLKAPEIKASAFDLVGYGWLRAAPIRMGENIGKPQGRFLVNPALHLL